MVMEGDRLWRFMYEAEECERGSCGRPVTGDLGTSDSHMEELRLTAGLMDLDDAGDCWEGGVYGIFGGVLEGGVGGLVGRSEPWCRKAH